MHTLVPDYFCQVDYENNNQRTTKDCKFIYLFRNPLSKLCKIGISNNPTVRFQKLQTESGIKLQKLLILELEINYDESPEYIEKYLHNYFKNKRVIGEWFNLSIKDIIQIRNLFYCIEGDWIEDYLKECLLKY